MPQAHFLDTWMWRIGNTVAITFWTPMAAMFLSVSIFLLMEWHLGQMSFSSPLSCWYPSDTNNMSLAYALWGQLTFDLIRDQRYNAEKTLKTLGENIAGRVISIIKHRSVSSITKSFSFFTKLLISNIQLLICPRASTTSNMYHHFISTATGKIQLLWLVLGLLQ